MTFDPKGWNETVQAVHAALPAGIREDPFVADEIAFVEGYSGAGPRKVKSLAGEVEVRVRQRRLLERESGRRWRSFTDDELAVLLAAVNEHNEWGDDSVEPEETIYREVHAEIERRKGEA